MKTCPKCGEEKPLDSFGNDRKTKDGLRIHCKLCNSAYARQWHWDNLERSREAAREWGRKNKDRANARSAAHYLANKERYRDLSKKWSSENREKSLKIKRRWTAKNIEKVKAKDERWKKANVHKLRHYCAMRWARKNRATPSWLTEEDRLRIESFFILAREREKETGVPHHVDHIVALRGKNFCGLHVPWNLQVLPWKDNVSKGNVLTEAAYEMPWINA